MAVQGGDAASPHDIEIVETSVHGRALVRQPPGAGPFPLLVGFHGYAENAAIHLDALSRIPGVVDSWMVCAVQALHPFYARSDESVVASWMTRLDREHAIADNVAYIRRVVAHIRETRPVTDTIVFAGFSQGASMAYRAAAGSVAACHGLIALAGDVPPDVASRTDLRLPPVLLGGGVRDDWYTEAKRAQDVERLARLSVTPQVVVFDGGHEWTDAFRREVAAFLDRVRPA